jgi:hypothetical protein
MRRFFFGAPRRARLHSAITSSFRPSVEPLEDRALPSALSISSLPIAVPTTAALGKPAAKPASHPVRLAGWISGTWTLQPTLPDTGTVQKMRASASFSGLGVAQVSGTLTTPGFVALGGSAQATLQITTARGSVTIQLTGPVPHPSPGGSPTTWHFTIVGGTGAYAGASGSGSTTLREKPAAHPTTAASFSLLFS